MNKLLEKKLQNDFPYLFIDMYDKNSGLAYGVDVKEGWFDLIYEMCCHIRAEKNDACKIASIKESFGTLRVSVEGGDENIYKIIDNAERESEHICASCGQPGNLQLINSVMKTTCGRCI